MRPEDQKLVLLFFQGPERDSIVRFDRYAKRLVRPAYNRLRTGQIVSGFEVWYRRLVEALNQAGWRVAKNNYAFARKHPDYPVGLVGYPTILDKWTLPNPLILGPGMYDHPSIRPSLMQDARFRYYIITCHWMMNLFQPYYGAACVPWYAGININDWEDTQRGKKSKDVLVYDKIRWNREEYEPDLLYPILRHLESVGLTYSIVKYGQYQYSAYRRLLGQCRSMIFLCEHETQGLAYQEALASGVPVLAWDNGYWLDPRRPVFEPLPVPATSVPYFSPECGERFRTASEFPAALSRFWGRLANYEPRRYVERELSLEKSAQLYLRNYMQIADEPPSR